MKKLYVFILFLLSLFTAPFGSVSQVFWSEDFNDAGAPTRWTTENVIGSKTNPTPAGIVGLSYIPNDPCNNYFVINDFNTPENSPYGVLPNGSTANYLTRFVRGRNYNCYTPNDLPNPDPGVTNKSLHVTFQGCSDSYAFGMNNGPEDYADEYSLINIDGPASPGASNSDQISYLTQDISTVGQCNISLEGQFFLGGDAAGAHSYATILYSINSGTTWKILADNIVPTMFFVAGTCNNWEPRSWILPAECEGITTLRIAFRWRNDANAISTTADYTLMAGFNVDNVVLKQIAPTADFNFGSMGNTILTTWTPCKMEDVTSIVNTSSGSGITGYQWSIQDAIFINGTDASTMNPDFRFPEVATFGVKNVTLFVFYGNNCTTSVTRTVTLQSCPPYLGFTAKYTTICATTPVPVAGAITIDTMINSTTSVLSRGTVNYTWTFSGPGAVTYVNGTNANSANPHVTFAAVGLYTVQLAATNLDGAGSNSPLIRTNYINAVSCECGAAAAGNIDIVSYDWNAGLSGWTVTQNQGSGAMCGAFGYSNVWRVEDGESARPPGICGAPWAGDPSLHFGAAAGMGAAFCAGGQNETDIIQSPSISTVGYTNLTLQFDFIGKGGGACCKADFQYSINGGAWTTPASPNFTTANPAVPGGSNLTQIRSQTCVQGLWTQVTWAMPAACENVADLKIRFRFIISGSSGAADPSFAVDKLKIMAPMPPSPPATWIGNTADWNNTSNWSTGAVPGVGTSVTIPDPVSLGGGKLMPAITANAAVLNVCNYGTITIGNGATNVTLSIGGFLNNFGAITSTNNNTGADIIFNGNNCKYRGGGINHDVDYQVGTSSAHKLTLESNLSCRAFNLANGSFDMSNSTLTLKKNFTQAASTTLTTSATSSFVFDGPMTANWSNPYSNPPGATITTQDVTTAQSITLGLNATFPNMYVRKQNDANVLTLASNYTHTISSLLQIESGTLNANTYTLSGAGKLTMTGGQLRLAKLSTTLPELTGVYTLTGGTIDFYGAGAQTARLLPSGSSSPYYNMIFQGSGIKSLTAGITTCNNSVTIQGTATVNASTNTFNGPATLTMANSACTLRVAKVTGSPTLPELTGNYSLGASSVIELYTSAAGTFTQYLRTASYSRLLFSNPTANCNITRYLTGNTGVSSQVTINNASGLSNIIDAQTYTFNGAAGLSMANNCTLRVAKNGVVQPEFTGTYTYTDGSNVATSPTLEFYGDGSQTVRLNTTYRNLLFSNIGTKTLQTGTTTATRQVTISNGVVVVPGSTDKFNGAANLNMTGGELRIATLQATANPIPEFSGTYALTAGRVTVNGAGTQTIRSSASSPVTTYHELNFAGSGVKSLSGDVTVNSRLLLNLPTTTGNYVNAGINTLTVNNDAVGAVNRSGGHVVGILKRAIDNTTFPLTYFYPVGSDNSATTTYYEPLFATLNSTFAGVTHLQSYFSKGSPSSNWTPPISESGNNYTDLETEGFWDLTQTGIYGAISYGTRVIPSSGWAYAGTSLALLKRSPALAPPDDAWNWHGSTRISDFEREGYTTFSEFGIASGSNPMPIETTPLVAFAVNKSKSILLQWSSLQEVNLKHYILQRCTTADFKNITEVSTIVAKGDRQTYSHQDFDVVANQPYYYRFKAIDNDGKTQYSNVATAALNQHTEIDFQIYPNPAKESISFSVLPDKAGNVTIEVFDMAQKKVLNFSKEIPENQVYTHKFNLEELSAGVYAYRISLNGKTASDKFVIIR